MRSTDAVFTEEHEAVRHGFRQFLHREVVPHYAGWRAAGAIPRAVFESAGDNGFLGICAPEVFGGAGLDDALFGLVMIEECLRVGATGLGLMLAAHANVVIPAIARFGDDETQAAWLPGLIAGTTVASLAATRSDSPVLRDILGVAIADVVLAAGSEGVLLVPLAGESIEPVPNPLGVEEAGVGELTLGTDKPHLIVVGDAVASESFTSDWYLWLATVDLAAADAALRLTIDYATQRKVFGAPLSGFENTRVSLARCAARLDAVAALALALLGDRAAGSIPVHRTAALRIASSELHQAMVDQGLQLHGGYGYMREYPIAQAYADAGLVALLAPLEAESVIADKLGLIG